MKWSNYRHFFQPNIIAFSPKEIVKSKQLKFSQIY